MHHYVNNLNTKFLSTFTGADLVGGYRGCAPPPPPGGLSNTTGILSKKMWFIGVHQSVMPFPSGAPPPKRNPGSAPVLFLQLLMDSFVSSVEVEKLGT